MDAQIEDFNWNLRLFLNVLDAYGSNVNRANADTFELLGKTIDKIENLLENADEVAASGGDAIACSFDETTFEIQRTIHCRDCDVSFGASRVNYLLHLADSNHSTKLLKNKSKEIGNQRSKSQETVQSQHDVPFDPNNNCKDNGDAISAANNNDQLKTQKINNLLSMLDAMRLEKSTRKINESVNTTFTVSPIDHATTNAKPAAESVANIKSSHEQPKNTAPAPAPKAIPNVFDDKIFDFITQRNDEHKNNTQANKNTTNGFNRDAKASLKTNWRERSNEPTEPVQPQWRRKDDVADSVTKVAATTSAHATTSKPAIKTNAAQAKSMEAPLRAPNGQAIANNQTAKPIATAPAQATQSIIHNGAILSGVGMKPCPAYALNNLYAKYPHLNPDKVPNPLKPIPLDELRRPNGNTANKSQQNSGTLQEFFDKINEKKSHGGQSTNRLHQMKELTSSLTSLPAFSTNSQINSAANRMPGRSVSSINLQGITRIAGSNPQKNGQKPQQTPQPNGQNRTNDSNRQQSNDQNRAKGAQCRDHHQTPNDAKSKGAIPKQTLKNAAESSSSNRRESPQVSNAGRNNTNANVPQTKEKLTAVPESKTVNLPKPIQNGADYKTAAVVVDNAKLQRFFSGDLSALVSMIIDLNLRPDRLTTQKKAIESVEHILKPTFKTIKCYPIGSHVYHIVKGGLATLDVYLDLHNTFSTDKSGSIFVNGMNDAQKLLIQSGEWIEAKCSEQTRYAILSAAHKTTNVKCNFSFGTGVAVRNTEVINSMFAAQPVARQLVLCIRLALQDAAVGDWAKPFGGYVVTLLVIFYLQTIGKLPSVLSLQSDPMLILTKCGENLVHFKNPTVAICKDRIRDLLIGFFDYYGNFDFGKKIISPFEGREINKNFSKCHVDSLSRSMRRFKSFIEQEPHRWTDNSMCVQDIFENKRNVTQTIQMKELKAFQVMCGQSLMAIQSAGSAVKY